MQSGRRLSVWFPARRPQALLLFLFWFPVVVRPTSRDAEHAGPGGHSRPPHLDRRCDLIVRSTEIFKLGPREERRGARATKYARAYPRADPGGRGRRPVLALTWRSAIALLYSSGLLPIASKSRTLKKHFFKTFIFQIYFFKFSKLFQIFFKTFSNNFI